MSSDLHKNELYSYNNEIVMFKGYEDFNGTVLCVIESIKHPGNIYEILKNFERGCTRLVDKMYEDDYNDLIKIYNSNKG